MSPDGTRLFSGSHDNTIRVWDLTTGALLHTLTGHTHVVDCLEMSPDGLKLVSGSYDKTIRVWDLTTGALLHTLTGHTGSVYCLKMSPDGLKLVSGSNDNTIRVWDLAAVPEQRISAVSKGGTISQGTLGSLPQFVQHRLFYLLYLIHQQKGKLPTTPPLNYGELAFCNEQGYAATDEEKRLALDLYSAHFFLHHVIDTFIEADDQTDEKTKAALVTEAFERFDRFSASIKNTTNVAYEELLSKQATGSIYENRVAALEGVYSHLLGKAGLKKISFNDQSSQGFV
jgi:WD40 repeat protein